MMLASAESQSLPSGALTPSVTRSGRSVRVLRAGARPVSRLPVSARERQLAHAESAIARSSTRRIADTVSQPSKNRSRLRANDFGGLRPKVCAGPRLQDHGVGPDRPKSASWNEYLATTAK
jgi:hypothetical protein